MATRSELIETTYPATGPVYVLGRVIDFCFGVLYTLLAVRFILELINAARSSGFFRLIASITEPFLAPFRGIVKDASYDGFTIAWSIVVALVAYMIGHALLRGLLRLFARG